MLDQKISCDGAWQVKSICERTQVVILTVIVAIILQRSFFILVRAYCDGREAFAIGGGMGARR